MGIHDTDRGLLQSVASGDHQAFWLLWERHSPYVRSICNRLLVGHPDDAEDALSETMLKAWESLKQQGSEIANVRAWLVCVGRNVCTDWWRRRGRFVSYSDVADETGHYEVADHNAGPEDMVLAREARGRAVGLMEHLPPRLRESMVLYAFHDLSYAEIARKLGITEANARKRMQQARGVLNEMAGLPAANARTSTRGELALPECATTALTAWDRSPDEMLPCETGEVGPELQQATQADGVVQVPLGSGAEIECVLPRDVPDSRISSRLASLRQYVEQHPQGWKKRLELAHALFEAGRWEQAFEEYQQVLTRQPRLIDVWLRLGGATRLMGNRAQAARFCEAALPYANTPAAQAHIRGMVGLCQGQHLDAIEHFRQAIACEPHNPAHWHALAKTYGEQGNMPQAAAAYEEILTQAPNDVTALVGSYSPLAAMGRLREAHGRISQAVDSAPESIPALRLLASARCHAGLVDGIEGQRTRELVTRVANLAPNSADCVDLDAQLHIQRGDTVAGLSLLEQFTRKRPSNPQGWLSYATWLSHTGYYQTAAEAILKADALFPRDLGIQRCACGILPLAERLPETRRVVDEILARYPGRWDSYAAVAPVLASTLADAQRACDLFEELPEAHRQIPAAWSAYGEVLLALHRWDDAASALQQCLSLLPEGDGYDQAASATLHLAECYRRSGDEGKAQEWLGVAASHCQHYIEIAPAIGHLLMAWVKEAMGHQDRALVDYRTALSAHILSPGREFAEQAVARLAGSKGKVTSSWVHDAHTRRMYARTSGACDSAPRLMRRMPGYRSVCARSR